ncbi:MAG TPA: histidine triad nucleotide-binding protein [Chloroflexota bacterium]|nr:histidine triad nucleotide-binding protein [Chloroflexota bacterium]
MTECLFCRVIAGEVPASIVHRDDRLTAFRDINPQAPTHILIVPNSHLTSTNEMAEEHVEPMGRIVQLAAALARQEGIAAGGYRLVVNTGPDAGQSVGHFHLHLLGGRRLGWPPG